MTRTFASVLLFALCVSTGGRAQSDQPTHMLNVYWIDVEGGAATLIVTPAGESVLIDAGNPGKRDAGRIHKVARDIAKLKQIDHLIVTHFHSDHFGGAADLAKLMPIGQVHDNGAPSPAPSERDAPLFAAYQAAFDGKRRTLTPGDVIPLAQLKGRPPVSLRLIGTREQFIAAPVGAKPNPECANATQKPADTSDNRNSTAWLLQFGDFRFFDGGDLTWNTEARAVCPVNLVGPVDVYQVNHHGLDVSNNPVLVRSLAPTVAVMNNGARKGTLPEVVDTLMKAPSIKARFQVHKNVRPDGANSAPDDYIANLEEKCEGAHIWMAVTQAADRYSITVHSRRNRDNFNTRRKS